MSKMPHPANLKNICHRCHSIYYVCEGCSCWDYSDSDLERAQDIQEEQAIQRYEDSLEPSDYESDEAQSRWEIWRTRNW